MNYWLFKTEPDDFSIDDLKNAPNSQTVWDGVRNYQARNMLRDKIKKDDKVFIYHSSCKALGIVGTATVIQESFPDPTQFDPTSKYFDPKATESNPRWFSVEISFHSKFDVGISLTKLKSVVKLATLPLVSKGNRLSIMPVSKNEWDTINNL